MGFEIRDAFLTLVPDNWRVENDFSPEISEAHKIIFHPFASDQAKIRVITAWLKRFQPCVFGRIAAQMNRVHFCLLNDSDFYLSDEDLQQKIQAERILWKQRCLHHERPEDGFLLWAVSPRLAYSSPVTLLPLTLLLRSLYIPAAEPDIKSNDLSWETLYLRRPDGKSCVRFRFSLDFFAVQGDGRWWHDHRIPGGMGFTANSVGYMIKSREWYESKSDQTIWGLKLAMETVDEAVQTKWGKAIYLRDLPKTGPFRGGNCPFSSNETLKPRLVGRDWSGYAGRLSTDHSIRKELFSESPSPPENLPEWNMDLRYLYDPSEPAFKYFVEGEDIRCADIYDEIGDPRDRRILGREHTGDGFLAAKIDELEQNWTPVSSEIDEYWK
jgi:hypothetical protein